MRVYSFVAIVVFLLLLAVCLVLVDGISNSVDESTREMNTALVRTLQLTDLAMWSEARYTRHPSQADSFTPFQNGPSALEHFPAGSWISPPIRFESAQQEVLGIRQGGEHP